MTSEVDRLLEVGHRRRADGEAGTRRTWLAACSLVFGWLALLSGGLSLVPGSRTGGFFDVRVNLVLAFLGIVLFGGLTLLTAVAGLLHIRFSRRRLSGGRQVAAGVALFLAGVGMLGLAVNL